MKKILFWAVIMLFAACGRIIKVSDLQYKEGERAVLYVFYADKAFDGEAWSDDGRSYKITVDCGILKRLECFDEDGHLFYVFDSNDRTELYFNEKGNEITERQARNLYPDKYKHLHNVLLEEFTDIINQRVTESNRNDKAVNMKAPSHNDISTEAEKELMAAELEINKIHEEIDIQFAKLIAAKEKSTTDNEIKEIIDVINSKYARYYGFLLTANQDTSLYNAARDKVKSTIAVEILKKRKQEALDKIHEEYYGY